jgi:putative transcriptional regulator
MTRSLYTEGGIVENEIRTRREALGLSQAALADALDVSRQTVNSLETGRYDPSLPLAFAVAHYFHATIEEIFHEADATKL